MSKEKELELAVGEICQKLKEAPDGLLVRTNLTFGELKHTLDRVMTFIDFCKFELGEDITDPYGDEK